MSEGWSVKEDNPWVGRKDLVPSNAPTAHIDPRMRLTLNDVKLPSGNKALVKLQTSNDVGIQYAAQDDR